MICKIGSYPCIVLVDEGHVELKIVFYKGTADWDLAILKWKAWLNQWICYINFKNQTKKREFRHKDLSIDEMVGAWCFGCLSGPPGFTCWIFLLRYSVLFTVESLSLLFSFFISWFICSRRWCIYKLGVFHANQISKCLDPHLNWRGWRRETGLSPPVKVFLLAVPRRCFFCGSYL